MSWKTRLQICLELGADLHLAQLMPLPLTVSCFSKIEIGFTFLVLAHLGSPGKRAVKWMCVCVCIKVDRVSIEQMCAGKEFQVEGADTEKARLLIFNLFHHAWL